jgi:hypothetical protein
LFHYDKGMTVFHSLYGLRLSANIAVPGLPVLTNLDGVADIRIWLGEKASPITSAISPSDIFYVSRAKDTNGEPILQAAAVAGGSYVALLYSDGTRFALERNGREVFADWPDPLTLEDSSPCLIGPVLGVVLRLRGIFPLHASAVSIDDHAIALMGPAGAGKSTTAGAFARCGHRVISDDVVALRQDGSRFVIPPGYPRLNLWAESVHAIFGAKATLPLISPSWDKHFMPLDQESQFETRSLPLGAIYVLQEREAGLAAPIVEKVTGAEAFVAVLRNTYMNHLPDQKMRCREFEVLTRVLAQVPVRRVRAAADPSMLFDLCETIAADARTLLPSLAL